MLFRSPGYKFKVRCDMETGEADRREKRKENSTRDHSNIRVLRGAALRLQMFGIPSINGHTHNDQNRRGAILVVHVIRC